MEKRDYVYGIVLCIILITTPLLQSKQLQNITTGDALSLNYAQIKHEKQQWKFLRTTLENELAHAENYRTLLGTFMYNHASNLALPIVPVLSYTGIRIAQDYLRLERMGLWEVGATIGTILAFITQGIIGSVGAILQGRASVHLYALNSFIRMWKDYKSKCPSLVYPIFDQLALDYEMHDTLKFITADQATVINEMALALSTLAENINLTLLTHTTQTNFNHSACAEPNRNNIPELVVQEFGNKQQWEYIAKQLGLLNPQYAISTKTQIFINNITIPLTLLLGIPLGSSIGSLSAKITRKYSEHTGMLYGGTIGTAITLLLCKFFGATQEKDWFEHQLVNFIEHWNYHRNYAPPALYPMFDELHILYLNNNRRINVNQKFIQELFQMMAVMWIKAAISEEQ